MCLKNGSDPDLLSQSWMRIRNKSFQMHSTAFYDTCLFIAALLVPVRGQGGRQRGRAAAVPHAMFSHHENHCFFYCILKLLTFFNTCEVLWSRWSRNYLISGAGAKIIFLINIFCSQLGG